MERDLVASLARQAIDNIGREYPNVPAFLLPVAWAVVGIPLAYGVYETVMKAIDLFS